MPIILKCKVCDKRFQVRPFRKNEAKYCSRKCCGKDNRNKRHSPKTEFKKGQPSPRKGKKYLQFSGKNHWNWKGGRRIHTYILIYQSYHPRANILKLVPEQVLIVEKALGRFLTKNEEVHHINSNKHDNRLKNLYLFSTQFAHKSYSKKFRHHKVPLLKSNLI